MSKPVTDVEIEDVLSSIRRLVTQGERVPAPRGDAADRLVLTPSLRVTGMPGAETAPEPEREDAAVTEEAVEAGESEGQSPLDLTAFRARRALRDRPEEVPEAALADETEEADEPDEVDALLARLVSSRTEEDDAEEEADEDDTPDVAIEAGTAAHLAAFAEEEDAGDGAQEPAAEGVQPEDAAEDGEAPETGFASAAPFVDAEEGSDEAEPTMAGFASFTHRRTPPATGETGPDADDVVEDATAAHPAAFAEEDEADDGVPESAAEAFHPEDDALDDEAPETGSAPAAPFADAEEGSDGAEPTTAGFASFTHRITPSAAEETGPDADDVVEDRAETLATEEPTFRSDRVALESTIAELEAAVRDEESFEPDGSERNPVMDWTSADASAGFFTSRMRRAAPPLETATDDDGIDEKLDSLPEPEFPQTAEMSEGAGTAEEADASETAPLTLHPAIYPVEPTADPDEAEEDRPVPASDATPVADLEEEPLVAQPVAVHPVGDEASPEPSGGVAAESHEIADGQESPEDTIGLPDTELLRRVVAEVLREELSGELGSRITANVRRLVRREVSRALNSETPLD